MAKKLRIVWICALLMGWISAQGQATFEFSTAQRGPVIGDLHYGIFYEEINHAGDGGLYAELVRNGSMEENAQNADCWYALGGASLSISTSNLINSAQKNALQLRLTRQGDGARNEGYWGMNIVEGQTYKASFWLRSDNGWKGDMTLTLEGSDGTDLGHTVVNIEDGSKWQKYKAEITAIGSQPKGWFALRGSQAGTIYLDHVSLFPPTYKGRENGMRPDLAEKLEALHPKFMRFPGGCYIEGGNRFQWRHTVGPVEERLGIYNSQWGYPVTNGMGFHEFLQLAEDLGAEPLFVVNIGLGHGWYQDYQHIEEYIQEALDALEYANGDVDTFWGAKRAAAGHPAPFNMRLIEIGNENYNYTSDNNSDQSDHYAERFHKFYTAIKARWPEVVCIGNVESWGTDNPTWRNQYAVDMVDEHYYRSPDWFASNYRKYDAASRSSHKIYNGEYAVTQDFGTNGSLKAALGEAIYMAGMERNSDLCVMASYAPIFMNENDAQWRPDMIHYNSSASFGTPSYWSQQMMASNVGHQNITWTEKGNNVNTTSNAKLGLGSWGTDATYTNIKVTAADGTVLLNQPNAINSPATTFGTAHVLDVVTDDCTIELDAKKNSGDEGFLITFAYADSENYLWWNLGGWGNVRHGVEQAINGSKSTLATTSGSIQTGKTYHVKVVRQGSTARCYLDGNLIHTVSSSLGQDLYLCASLNQAEDKAIVKVINYSKKDIPTTFRFTDATLGSNVHLRVMNNPDNSAENTMANPMNVSPQERNLSASGNAVEYTVPAYSLSILTIPLTSVSPEAVMQATNPPSPAIRYSFENGEAKDDAATLTGTLSGGASLITLDDGNHVLYTGPSDKAGYLDLGNEAAKAIGKVINGEAWSVSLDILLTEGGHLNNYCWAWNINNGTNNYAGLINQANNLNWYFEKVRSGTCKVSSLAGLSQQVWHNITITSDAEATSIYIDGELRSTEMPNKVSLTLGTTTRAWLGRSPFEADAVMTNILADDFTIYAQKLTPSQVLMLSQQASKKSTQSEILNPKQNTETNAAAAALIGEDTKEVDITSLLVNPDFAAGSRGWEGSPLTAAPGTVAEHFSQLFDTYQILDNMPAGHYRLWWQGFYRNGNIDNAYLRHTMGTETMAEVYAASVRETQVSDLNSTSMLSIYDSSAPYTRTPYTYPDNVSTADKAFSDGNYVQQMVFTLPETSDLRIGLRNFAPAVYDWACFDNFHLVYVGRTDGLGTISESPAAPIQGEDVVYNLSGQKIPFSALESGKKSKGIYIWNGKKIIR